jgi:hypothetical protein
MGRRLNYKSGLVVERAGEASGLPNLTACRGISPRTIADCGSRGGMMAKVLRAKPSNATTLRDS